MPLAPPVMSAILPASAMAERKWLGLALWAGESGQRGTLMQQRSGAADGAPRGERCVAWAALRGSYGGCAVARSRRALRLGWGAGCGAACA